MLLVVLESGKLVNCIRVPRAPSHTETGSSPLPRPWKQNPANDKGWYARRPSSSYAKEIVPAIEEFRFTEPRSRNEDCVANSIGTNLSVQ